MDADHEALDAEVQPLIDALRREFEPPADVAVRLRAGIDARIAGTARLPLRIVGWSVGIAALIGGGALVASTMGSQTRTSAVSQRETDVDADARTPTREPVRTSASPREVLHEHAVVAREPVVAATDAPEHIERVRGRSSVAVKRGHRARAPAEPATPDTLAAELGVLRRAERQRQSGDFAAALDSLAEHARTFPDGALAPERDAARVLVLCEAERHDEAREAARTFDDRHPRSHLRARFEGRCLPAKGSTP
jgi:hypothetical protein